MESEMPLAKKRLSKHSSSDHSLSKHSSSDHSLSNHSSSERLSKRLFNRSKKIHTQDVLDKVVMKTKTKKRKRKDSRKSSVPQYIINIMNNVNNPSQNSFDPTDSIEHVLINYYNKKFKKCCIITFYKNWLEDKDFEKQTWSPLVDECVNKINQCIRNKGQMSCIAILFSFYFGNSDDGHTNLLLFKPYKKTLEWYEPHGKFFFGNDTVDDNNKLLVDYLIQRLQEVHDNAYSPIQLISPMATCPFFGFQTREGRSDLPDLSGGGYCMLWSILIMKLALKFPNKTIEEISTELQHLYHRSDDLRKLMYAFTNEISNILLKHYNITLDEFNANPHFFNFEDEDKHTTSSLQNSTSSNKHIRIIRKNMKEFSEDSDSAMVPKEIAYTYPVLIRKNKHHFTFIDTQSSSLINEEDALNKFKIKKTYLIKDNNILRGELFLKITGTIGLHIVGIEMSPDDPTLPINSESSITIPINEIESVSEVILR